MMLKILKKKLRKHLIVSMGRKTISRMIRITMIKDVIELTK